MPFYKIHILLFHLVPVVFALFGAWLLARKGKKALLGWGMGITLVLLILIVAFPSTYILYNNGPMAFQAENGPGLPLSTLIELAILHIADGRVPFPRWTIVLFCILIGQWPIMVGAVIA